MADWSTIRAPDVASLAANGAIGLWPIGATEQHGSHLPTGFDTRAAGEVVARAEHQLGDAVVVLPPLAIGASEHWLTLGSTLSLQPATLVLLINDVIRSAAQSGLRCLLIVNGHAGNTGPLLCALGSGQLPLTVRAVSYWNLVESDEIAARCLDDDGGIGHAGEVETSIGLYLDPESVSSDRMTTPGQPLGTGPGSRRPLGMQSPEPEREAPQGVYGDPRRAHPDLGRFVIEQAASGLCSLVRELQLSEHVATADPG